MNTFVDLAVSVSRIHGDNGTFVLCLLLS